MAVLLAAWTAKVVSRLMASLRNRSVLSHDTSRQIVDSPSLATGGSPAANRFRQTSGPCHPSCEMFCDVAIFIRPFKVKWPFHQKCWWSVRTLKFHDDVHLKFFRLEIIFYDPIHLGTFFVGKMGEDKWSGQSLGGDSCDLLVSAAVIVAGLCVVGALSPRGRCGHGARRAPAGGSSFIRTRLDLLKEMRVGLQKVTC